MQIYLQLPRRSIFGVGQSTIKRGQCQIYLNIVESEYLRRSQDEGSTRCNTTAPWGAARAEASARGGPLCVLRRLRPARSAIQPTRVWPCVENQKSRLRDSAPRTPPCENAGKRTTVGSRRFRLADAFGTTFWCQKVVNPLLAGNAKEKVRNGSEAHSCRPKVCQNIQLLLRLCKLRCTALRTPSDCSGYFPASSGTCSFAAAIFCRLISLAASLSRRR